MKQQGFTLIEILIALAVFAILATLTAMTLSNMLITQKRLTQQTNQLATLDLSLVRINQDMQQVTQRAVRDPTMHFRPMLIGEPRYIEFTRSGLVNPQSVEKRPTLKRVALICKNNQLIRRIFPSLDGNNPRLYSDTVLLANLEKCRFQYLNEQSQFLDKWVSFFKLPKAMQLDLTLSNWGALSLVFLIPEGAYATI